MDDIQPAAGRSQGVEAHPGAGSRGSLTPALEAGRGEAGHGLPGRPDPSQALPLPDTASAALPVVALGGSAGAIAALREFFANVPAATGMAFVVVLHLSPEHESTLPQLLQRHTPMPVKAVTDRMALQADTVYVIPPGKHLSVVDERLRLSDLHHERGKRVAVDLFFRSLADSHGPRATAVVLSGADGDGTIGLRRIKEHGGLTIAQDADEAEHAGMPESAAATGMVDWILPVAQIPSRIVAYHARRARLRLPDEDGPQHACAPEKAPDRREALLRDVLSLLRTQTGSDFSYYKRATIVRRIARRMQVTGTDDLAGYLEHLRTQPGEASALMQDLLISVTNFFRDPAAFQALDAMLGDTMRRKRAGEAVRIWCPACATGEEAYSMAILLLEHAHRLDASLLLQVFACDLDQESIRVARAGFYPDTIAADVSEERLRRFFVKEPGGWRVRRELREMVLFATHDLLKDAPFSRQDLISCRNLLIYLDRDAQQRALDIFHFAIRPEGLLFLGSSESAEDSPTLFVPLDKRNRIYRRRALTRLEAPLPFNTGKSTLERFLQHHDDLKRAPVVVPGNNFFAQTVQAPPPEAAPAPSPLVRDSGLAADQLLDRLGPASMVVDGGHDIVHLSANAGRLLRMPEGEPTRNLLRLLHPMLRVEMRAALLRAQDSGEAVQIEPRAIDLPAGASTVGARVVPAPDMAGGCVLIIFRMDEPQDLRGNGASATPELPALAALVEQLEGELALANARLRSTVARHKASTEELKAGNEELQAMNEELRSASEELESGREELQSLNEELTTVNAEYRSQVEELARANSDLHNLMSATQIATVFLGRGLEVMRYTPAAAPLFNLIPGDLGRPIVHLHRQVDYPQLIDDAERVLRTLVPIERELRDGEHWFLARVLPYRTVDDHIAGVVLTFVDITERRSVEKAIREGEERQTFLLELSDALRELDDPAAIRDEASRRLRDQLDADYARCADVDTQADMAWDDDVLRRGDCRVVCDTGSGPATKQAPALAIAAPAPRSELTVPLIHGDQLVGTLDVVHSRPHDWSDHELALAREVGERIRAAVERARAEARVRASEDRYRSLFESMDEGFCVIELTRDAQGRVTDYRHVEINPAFARHTGLHDAQGQSARELIPDLEDSWLVTYDEVARTGEPRRFEREVRSLGRWLSVYAFRIGTASTARVAVLFTDISDRRLTELALRDSEERFRAFVTASSEVVYRADPAWSQIRQLNGQGDVSSAPEPFAVWLNRYIPPSDQAAVRGAIDEAVHTGMPFELEHRVTRANQTPGWALTYAIPILDSAGRLREWLGAASDVTRRKQMEVALREADRSKDDFLATLAHELRNPLAPIHNAIQVLRDRDDGPTELLDVLQRQTQHMMYLVNDLLDVARISHGGIKLKRVRMDLRSALDTAIEASRPLIDAGGHDLDVEVEDVALPVHGDMVRLTQVYTNLLNNAAKYTEYGGRIRLVARREADAAVVTITDSGMGIAAGDLHNLFEPFNQLAAEGKRAREGLGLGLHLAQRLVQMHGGSIHAASDGPGLGSSFSVRIALSALPQSPVAVQSAAANAVGLSAQRVLVVDDNADSAETLVLLLQGRGISARAAFDGESALREMGHWHPTTVLLDLGMPEMDGYEVARRVKADPALKGLKLVALTGWGGAMDRHRTSEAGFGGHLTKPVTFDALCTLFAAA